MFYSVHVSKPICLCVSDDGGESGIIQYAVREEERINNCVDEERMRCVYKIWICKCGC